MINKFNKGDRINISYDESYVNQELEKMYKDSAGRKKILDDILDTEGVVKATIVENPTEVLYMKDNSMHSWWIPNSITIQ